MGQRALCCCLQHDSSDAAHAELQLAQPLRLPAPPARLLAPSTKRRLRCADSSNQLVALVQSSPLTSRLPPAVLLAVYRRTLHLYHLPAEHLAWKAYETTPASAASTPSLNPSVYYSSLHTGQTTWQPPAHYTPLTPADYNIQPALEWFPGLTQLAASLHLSVRFHDDTTPLLDSYYQRLVEARSPSLPHLLYTLPLLTSVLSSYPASFYRRLPLSCVVLCERLHYKGAPWRCVPVLTAGRMYVSVERCDAVYLQSTLHHELFHFVDHSLQQCAPPQHTPLLASHSALRNHIATPDPQWCALNVPSFEYGGGGLAVRDAGASSAASSPCAGLLNAYAASAAEEDRAEVWAALMRDEAAVSGGADDIVRRKAALLRARVEAWSAGSLGQHWWSEVRRRAFSHEARKSTAFSATSGRFRHPGKRKRSADRNSVV